LIATFNQGKLQELSQLLVKLPFVICDLGDSPSIQPIPETGETFIDNASLKATGYAKQAGLLTLADDSGLEVDDLNGAPGVLSPVMRTQAPPS
jgi:XTP/dITP diphosphohydrolase